VVSTAPPPWNGPLLVSAQAIPVIGLVPSLEVDTSETGSPVCGRGGNHLKEASGGVGGGAAAGVGGGTAAGVGRGASAGGVTTGGGVTVNVTGLLLPAGSPTIEFSWVATAVYCPLGRAGLAPPDAQAAPVPMALALETTVPFAAAPA
jgi:hypothetical protein